MYLWNFMLGPEMMLQTSKHNWMGSRTLPLPHILPLLRIDQLRVLHLVQTD